MRVKISKSLSRKLLLTSLRIFFISHHHEFQDLSVFFPVTILSNHPLADYHKLLKKKREHWLIKDFPPPSKKTLARDWFTQISCLQKLLKDPQAPEFFDEFNEAMPDPGETTAFIAAITLLDVYCQNHGERPTRIRHPSSDETND